MNDFLKILADGTLPKLLDVALTILTIVLTYVGYQGGKNLKNNRIFKIAWDIFHIVEENYRGQVDVTQQKIEDFETNLLKKVPNLTPEQVEYYRQAIAGEFNKLKNDIKPVDVAKISLNNVGIDTQKYMSDVLNEVANQWTTTSPEATISTPVVETPITTNIETPVVTTNDTTTVNITPVENTTANQ